MLGSAGKGASVRLSYLGLGTMQCPVHGVALG